MRRLTIIPVLAICVLFTGCYHATIETGLQPDGQTITQKWASGWLFGLVPPKTVEAAAKCPNGVSRVETQLSFLNQLVRFLTIGIYTPMQIEVACGTGSPTGEIPTDGQEIVLSESASTEEIQEAFADAANRSYRTNSPVYVRFVEADIAAGGS